MAPRVSPAPVRRTGRAATARPKPSHEPVRTAPANATQRIADAIAAAIIERRLMPGTKLAEQRIADVFQVSRTLVRQALMLLSREHLVTLAPARGARVAEPSLEEARQVFEVRRLLESALMKQAAATLDDHQLAELRAHLRRQQHAVHHADATARARLLADFHVVLARMLGNGVLADIVSDLVSRSSLIALMYPSTHSAEQSLAGHTAIVDALERRDARAAARLMQTHLSQLERGHLALDVRTTDLHTALLPGRTNDSRSPSSP